MSVLYPESPKNISKDFTKLPASYKIKATLAIFAIVLFFALFSALVASFSYLTYYAFTYEMETINRITIIGKIAAIAGSVMLLAFTLKFIFKLRNHKPDNRIKLKKEENPELWAFINQICQETGAPKPKNIYVDPDVNAYVAYSNTWLSLFLPVRKELTIGMALVSCVNLTEFKAVIAHEFGHFAQRSMKIGSYIISANTIIHDMIFSRDKWDELLATWRGTDIRLSFAAWIITPIIWCIRQLLRLFYLLLNLMYSLLSREMEFNADKVAVKVAGSDAIISALWKLDEGNRKWQTTMNHAYLAGQKKLFAQNLFVHHDLNLQKGKFKVDTLLAQLPKDPRGGKTFFTTSENSKTSMYASHPPNDKRQDNAKKPFVEAPLDERSPWILFNAKEKVQTEMTQLVYKKYLNKEDIVFTPDEVFDQFVQEESVAEGLMEDYKNTFLNRFLTIPNYTELTEKAARVTEPLKEIEVLKEEIVLLMHPIIALDQLMQQVQEIAQGTSKEKVVHFNGVKYNKKRLNEVAEKIELKREQHFSEDFIQWDQRFCAVHYALCKDVVSKSNLMNLYMQYDTLAGIFKELIRKKNIIYKDLRDIQAISELTELQLTDFGISVQNYMLSLNKDLDKLDTITFVPLPNIESIKDLKNAIIEGGKFEKEEGKIFENGGFDRILNRLEQTVFHLQRIDQKGMNAILQFHEKLIQNEAIN